MKRAAVAKIGSAAPHVQYGSHDDVIAVVGRALRDGARELVGSASHAADVRGLFGRPDREDQGHVFATVGGFFWYYQRPGVVIGFSFVDDRFTLGDKAPLHDVQLIDPTAYETSLRGRDRAH